MCTRCLSGFLKRVHTSRKVDARLEDLSPKTNTRSTAPAPDRRPPRQVRTFTAVGTAKTESCLKCQGSHSLKQCQLFRQLSVPARWELVKPSDLCINCLQHGHRAQTCSVAPCQQCKKKHHAMLHQDRGEASAGSSSSPKPSEKKQEQPTRHDTTTCASFPGNGTALMLIPVVLQGKDEAIQCTALLDSGSTTSYIREDVAKAVGLQGELETLSATVLGGKKVSGTRERVTAGLGDIAGTFQTTLSAWVLPTITNSLEATDWNSQKAKWPHLEDVTFPQITSPQVDILIGVNCAECHVCLSERRGRTTEPIARQTPLGWTCFGQVDRSDGTIDDSRDEQTMLVLDKPLDVLVQQFWSLEADVQSSALDTPSVDDRRAEMIVDGGKSFDAGRFTYGIPWNTPDSRPHLRSNRTQAERRLRLLEKTLSRKPAIGEEYHRVMAAHESKGYIREVSDEEVAHDGVDQWYLPHFPVVRADKATTKVRVVYDAAATWDGTSLNEQMFSGPALQNDIINVLLKFSMEPVALVGDVSEMFLQVGLEKADRRYHRLVWRASDLEPVRTYEFNCVVFGVRASPYLAGKAIKDTVKKFGGEYAESTGKLVNDSLYVDDLLGSLPSEEAAITARLQTQELLSKGGFHMRKWLSNREAVMETVPESDRATSIALNLGEHVHCSLPTVKTLGVSWTAGGDAFTFRYHAVQPAKYTKRSVLSGLATIFDPRGQIVPFTVRAKVLFQDAWLCNLGWDDPLPPSHRLRWQHWFDELPDLAALRIPRSFKESSQPSADAQLTIHTFTDASDRALAAVSYVRAEYPNGLVRVTLGIAKSKPAAVRRQTIPLLELQAAVMGVGLSQRLENVLGVPIAEHQFWTDSMNVLSWLQAHSRRFRVEVGNRVSKIQSLTSPEQWRHIPGRLNPADKGTRGQKASEMVSDQVWWHGPEFLTDNPETWPTKEVTPPEKLPGELKHAVATLHADDSGSSSSCRLSPSNFSSWIRLVRVTAWIRRWYTSVIGGKKPAKSAFTVPVAVLENGGCPQRCSGERVEAVNVPELTVHEIKEAEYVWYARAQREAYQATYENCLKQRPLPPSNPLIRLQPELDVSSPRLLRMNGRLKTAHHLPEGVRRPIILPEKHPVTALRIAHEDALHNHTAGVQHILASLNTVLWIVHGPVAVKRHRHSCPACKRLWGKPSKQQMAPLPDFRTAKPQRAFIRVGVDYAGPFMTRQGRGKVRTKRYLCLFTCLQSRAVHLEMSWSLDTESFLQAFTRFVKRRGVPEFVVSDNGGNFVAAEKELRHALASLDQTKIASNLGM